MPPKKNKVEGKTPYQGNERCFGHYKCPNCQRFWMSSHSWANYGQMCKKCQINVYPFRQDPLEKPGRGAEKINPNKPHEREFCEKCRAMGRYCASDKAVRGRRRRRRR